MKKVLFLFIALTFTLLNVDAQGTGYWDLNGNNNADASNFIGTTGPQPLIFKTWGTERMQLHPEKAFLGIGVSIPRATLHLHNPQNSGLIPLLQLTTAGTGNLATNGFAVFSDYTTRDIKFKQQEDANFFIEGQNGGIVINTEGDIGIGMLPPPRQMVYRAPNLHTQGILFAGSLEASSARLSGYITTQTLNAQSATIANTLTATTATIDGVLSANSATINDLLTADRIGVENLLCAQEVKVQVKPCWPDYVFSKNYNLMSLQELEQFVNENQHLPEIPSAATVEENGIELGEMNAKFLKKIEELTLYIIDLQKQIDELKNK